MELFESYQMEEFVDTIKNSNIQEIIAENIKNLRLEHYQLYKKKKKGIDNPYSTENIASLLDISKRHYTRIENPKYTTKNINIEKLLILSKIYNKSLDYFTKKINNITHSES